MVLEFWEGTTSLLWTDKHMKKHYLPATSFADSKNAFFSPTVSNAVFFQNLLAETMDKLHEPNVVKRRLFFSRSNAWNKIPPRIMMLRGRRVRNYLPPAPRAFWRHVWARQNNLTFCIMCKLINWIKFTFYLIAKCHNIILTRQHSRRMFRWPPLDASNGIGVGYIGSMSMWAGQGGLIMCSVTGQWHVG